MSSFETYLNRMSASGNSVRMENINDAKYYIQETFTDDPAYIPEGTTIWNSNRIIHPRIYSFKYKTSSPSQRRIQTIYDEPFYLGDTINCGTNGWWMCVAVNDLHGIQWEGTLQHCNHHIKFISPLDGTVREYPVSVTNATQYGNGEIEKTMIRVGAVGYLMYLMQDEHTVLLDSKNRFMMDKNLINPTVYRCTQTDTSSMSDGFDDKHGIVRIYLKEDEYNPKTDDKENMLADAWADDVGGNKDIVETDKWI